MTKTRPYDFMVTYTPQRQWIEGRGIILWLAFFFIELGAGTFIVSSIFGSPLGMVLGWLLCAVLGGGLHLLYLGHPLRFWRIMLSSGWKTSWISRGLFFVTFSLLLGAIHIILVQWADPSLGLLVAADVFAFLTVVYVGFVMNYVNGIPLWNTPVLPLLYSILGIWGGLGVTLITMLGTGETTTIASIEEWSQIFLLAFIFIVFTYLFSIRYQGATGRTSVRQIVAGRLAPLFWTLVVALAMVLPLVVAASGWLSGSMIAAPWLWLVIAFELLGDLALRYCVLRGGIYAPLIPTMSQSY